jgi:hypothetical protein
MQQDERTKIAVQSLRKKLEDLSTCKGYSDPEVVSLSQELDELLNQFWRLYANKSMI